MPRTKEEEEEGDRIVIITLKRIPSKFDLQEQYLKFIQGTEDKIPSVNITSPCPGGDVLMR